MSNSVHCAGSAREIVLASASPRRRDILQTLGLSFIVDPADVDETVKQSARIDDVVRELALAKAREVASRHERSLIVAADTLVELDGRILGKPSSPEDARRILSLMAGRQHRVVTGLVLLDQDSGKETSSNVETLVTFRPMTASEIEAYVATREPLDKAGSYGIQGLGAAFVDRIEGDYYNVAGLPVAALNDLLEAAGCCIICRALQNLSE